MPADPCHRVTAARGGFVIVRRLSSNEMTENFLLAGVLVPMLAVWALYRFGPAVLRGRWRQPGSQA